MDRLQVIVALQKWIATRREEAIFQTKYAEVLSQREAHRKAVSQARAALTTAMSQMMEGRPADETDKPLRISMPAESILIELQQGASDIICSRVDITFPAKPAT
jgi:hypothetical protein